MRYIGNKTKLLSNIDELLEEKNIKTKGMVFCDLFSGTATVSLNYKSIYKIIANDILDFSYTYSAGVLLYNNSKFKGLSFDPFVFFNAADTSTYTCGFCYNNFSPNGKRQYFSDDNAKKIDYIRNTIEEWYNEKKITQNEKYYLIACLLESISKVSNVAGVYSAYLKIWDSRAIKPLVFSPIIVPTTRFKNAVYCENANDLISRIKGDILYLDPPYTPTQYCSQYHVLETIVRNDNPKTHGIGAHRENDRLSNWCKKGKVEFEFEKIIKEANFKHIIFSYSDKGIMSLDYIESVLKRYAKKGTYTFKKINFVKYKNTRSVEKELAEGTANTSHYEYLFYIEKNENAKYISPLNYIGGKYDTLDLIQAYLPQKINTFYDLFGGGATVGINVGAKKIIYNDINYYVKNLLEYFSKNDPTISFSLINDTIKNFGLDKSNKDAYLQLRNNYNKSKDNILLYLLICYGFEHQIRYNNKHEFNNPCGNSSFNSQMYEKLISYYLRCNSIDIDFCSKNYNQFLKKIRKNDFVYLDPPYLSNNGVYQDGKRGFNGWNIDNELEMYNFIEKLNKKGVRFMLSNYTDHKGKENDLLLNWVKDQGYRIHYSKVITKRNRQNRKELIVVNYGE